LDRSFILSSVPRKKNVRLNDPVANGKKRILLPPFSLTTISEQLNQNGNVFSGTGNEVYPAIPGTPTPPALWGLRDNTTARELMDTLLRDERPPREGAHGTTTATNAITPEPLPTKQEIQAKAPSTGNWSRVQMVIRGTGEANGFAEEMALPRDSTEHYDYDMYLALREMYAQIMEAEFPEIQRSASLWPKITRWKSRSFISILVPNLPITYETLSRYRKRRSGSRSGRLGRA
jgi:hypothetical protein